MRSANLRRGVIAAVLSAVLAGCATDNTAELQAQEAARLAALAAAARIPPPVTLSQKVAEDASIYLAFSRDMATIEGGFADAESIQAALRRGSAYDPAQLSRGLVAYASILALQSPEFVAGVRQYATDRTVREELAANIASDPRWASTLPGADAAAGLITSTLSRDIQALGTAANSIENDAYAIQAAYDPRRSWGVAQVAGREARLEDAKVRSTQRMAPSQDDAARLLAAARSGGGLGVSGDRRRAPPYPPVVEKALALAALAALGEAGDAARARTDALQEEPVSQACLNLSKLMLFQCLAASRPAYEDMFCLGRHVVRDIATCTRGAAMPAAVVSVSDVSSVEEPRITPAPRTPDIAVSPAPALPPIRTAPVAPAAPAAPPAPPRVLTPTERLNTAPASPGG